MRSLSPLALALALLSIPVVTMAHGYAGKRFFPATMAVDDPFIADEAGMLFGHNKDDDNTLTNDISVEYAKTITPNLALSIATDYLRVQPKQEQSETGFDNSSIGAKYLLYKNDQHESLISIGAEMDLGGTGDSRVGAESDSTLSPALYLGKGLGDLPETMKYLRPMAITAVISPSFNTSNGFNSETIDTGITVSYDLGYLQNFVKDVGLGAPFNHLIGIVEMPLSTCTTGECGGDVTGTINPGIIWRGSNFQLGLEATIPVNQASGNHTGILAQVHFYVDDIFPHSLGRPIFR